MKRKILALLLSACITICGCGAADEKEEPVAFSVNGEAISYREWNFYVRMNQMQWEKSYLDSYGDDMWSMEAGEDGETLADALKEDVLETICQIHLSDQHAEEYGAALSEEQKRELRQRAEAFMGAYHEALLRFADADEEFVYERLCEKELSLLVAELSVADFEPSFAEEEVHREGICYVLISTTGLRDQDGNLEPFSEEEVERRTRTAQDLCEQARKSGDLKSEAEAIGLTPIESSMGISNENDGQEARMLDAARLLAVGEISDPVWTEEGWFLVQHTNDYDEEGTAYWKEYLTDMAREEEYARIYKGWRDEAEIVKNQEIMEQSDVKIVLKELL